MKYTNNMPLIIFSNNDDNINYIKRNCEQNSINCYELTWLQKLIDFDLTAPEIIYVKWCLMAAHYHKWIKIDSVYKSDIEIIKEFLDTFCTVTGDNKDCYRSQVFYEKYVVPYYNVQKMDGLGYKRFNKFLKDYRPGFVSVYPKHKSRFDNVQHIWGIKFDDNKFLQYMTKVQSNEEKQKLFINSYIDILFKYALQDFNAISAQIEANKS